MSRFRPYWIILSIIPVLVFAGPVGPRYSGTVAQSGSGTSWSNISNAAGSSSGDYASITLSSNGELSQYLVFTNFGFSIPAGYQIDGVVVEVNSYQSTSGVEDNSVYLVKGGVIQTGGDNKGNGTDLPSGPPGSITSYGNATDDWSVALTESDIEDSGFGVALRMDKQGGGAASGFVDWVRITVHASTADTGSSPDSDREVSAGGTGDIGWTPLANQASASDNVYESVTLASGENSQYLIVDNFGFSIPSGNTILGIEVTIERASSGDRTSDYSIVLVDEAGNVLTGGDDKANTGADWPTTDGVASYGGASDLWGQAAGFWTPAKINDPDFGLAIAVVRENTGPPGNRTARVDHVTISITHEDPIALPVELVYFKAKAVSDDQIVELTWQTASEEQNDFFTVERSINGKDFDEVLKIDGAGNSNNMVNYSALDHFPLSGISYYRLKQTDLDGSYAHSSITSVRIKSLHEQKIAVYPNPVRTNETLKLRLEALEASNVQLEVFGIDGSLLSVSDYSVNASNKGNLIDTELALPPGVYVVRLTSETHSFSERIMVK